MDTLNERIKEVRKKLGLSQKDFAQKVGISQRSVSWGEQPGNNVPDSTIKSLCIVFRINEAWLRTGDGDMFIEPDTFSLDQYAKERGASDLELAIAKAYFDLPQDVRSQMLAKLKSLLNGEAEVAAELAPVLPSTAGQGLVKPPDNLEGLTTEELEALYAEQQYKKQPPGVHRIWRHLLGILPAASRFPAVKKISPVRCEPHRAKGRSILYER